MNRQQAGKKGGQATLRKHGREHMVKIGRRGAATTWKRYHLQPAGVSDFAMVRKSDGEVIAFLSGRPWGER